MSGKLRQGIIGDEECPEKFEEKLSDFIDEVEGKVNEVKDLLDIKGLNDLGQIADAKTLIDELSESLY